MILILLTLPAGFVSADDEVPDGGRLPYETPTSRKGQRLLGAVGSAEAWAAANGCGREPETSSSRQGALERRAWCADGAGAVVFLGLENWGHDWPGPNRTDRLPNRTDRLPSSEPLRGFHLAEEMWSFFSERFASR